ncbi:hypothetical protein, partial [Bullifex sp.]|uniref:hypothetical protein n=1 Tax=Bullifex sp. TaxID=2815808 RepID=UPI002A805BB2
FILIPLKIYVNALVPFLYQNREQSKKNSIIEVKRDNKNNLKHPMLNTNNRVGVIASGLQIYY